MNAHRKPPQGTHSIRSGRQINAALVEGQLLQKAAELAVSDPVVAALAAAKSAGDQTAIAWALPPFLARYGRGPATLRLYRFL